MTTAQVKQINRALSRAEKLKNNVVLILGVIGSAIIAATPVLSSADFTTLTGVYAAIPAIAALIGRANAFGPVTVAKLAELKAI